MSSISFKKDGPGINEHGLLLPDDLMQYASYDDSPESKVQEDYTALDQDIELYWKVGYFFGWSWQEYDATPRYVTEKLSAKIDETLTELFGTDTVESVPGAKINLPFYRYLEVLLAIGKAFGGSKD